MTPVKHREDNMSTKLAITALIALSVSALTEQVESGEYSAEELNEALAAETAGENRKTALTAIKAAITDATADAEEPKGRAAGLYVCAGKAITTKAGMKSSGDEIKEGMISGSSAEKLVKKGFLEVQE